jgi:hypothetical protein
MLLSPEIIIPTVERQETDLPPLMANLMDFYEAWDSQTDPLATMDQDAYYGRVSAIIKWHGLRMAEPRSKQLIRGIRLLAHPTTHQFSEAVLNTILEQKAQHDRFKASEIKAEAAKSLYFPGDTVNVTRGIALARQKKALRDAKALVAVANYLISESGADIYSAEFESGR